MRGIVYYCYSFALVFVFVSTLNAQKWYEDEPVDSYEDNDIGNNRNVLLDVLKKVEHQLEQKYGSLDRDMPKQNPYDDFYSAVAFSEQNYDLGLGLGLDLDQNEQYDSKRSARFPKLSCKTKISHGEFSEPGFEFIPYKYYNLTCQPSTGNDYVPSTCPCLVDATKGCQTTYKEISVFKKRVDGSDCWKPTTRLVATGCRCVHL